MLTVTETLKLNDHKNIIHCVRTVLSNFSNDDVKHITRIEMSFDMVFDMNVSGQSFYKTFSPLTINYVDEPVGELFGHTVYIIKSKQKTVHNMSVHFDKKYVRYKKIYNILNDVNNNYIREVYKYELDDNYQKIKSIL